MNSMFEGYGSRGSGLRRDVRRRRQLRPPYRRLRHSLDDDDHPRAGRAGSRRCRPATSTRASPSTSAARSGRSRSTSCRGSSRWTPGPPSSAASSSGCGRWRPFLADVYDAGQVFDDGVIPRRVVTTSSHFHRAAASVRPPNGVRVHVSGIDLIRDDDGEFRVLEDNVRVPSGVSYVMTNRRAISRGAARDRSPSTGSARSPATRSGCSPRCAPRRRPASPTRRSSCSRPGVYNGAYFEHALLARTMGVELVEGRDLECRRGRVMMRTTKGLEPVHVIYRRVDDEFLDPVHFRADSMLGCPGPDRRRPGRQRHARQRGRQRRRRRQARLHLPARPDPLLPRPRSRSSATSTPGGWATPEAREEVLDRLDELVLKPVDGSGGKGIVIGPAAPTAPSSTSCGPRCSTTRAPGSPSPSSSSRPCRRSSTAGSAPRHVDLRPFAVNDGQRVWVLPGGLTRVALGRGRADRELLPRRRLQGHLGARRRRARPTPDRDEPPDVAPRPPSRRPRRAPARALEAELTGAAGRSSSSSSSGGGAVLSRIAESMFWIGRYVERAEDTARILDVQTQLILEDAGVDEEPTCRDAAVDHGRRARRRRAAGVDVGRWCSTCSPTTRTSPASIAAALGAARESARRARETLSVPMWEAINTTYRAIPIGPVPGAAAAGDLPVGARAGRADQRHRRRDDDPRRGLAVPDARPLHRARRHDLAAGRDRGAGRAGRRAVDHHAARVRRLRGVPAHLPRPGDRARGGGVPAARPAVPAVGGLRAQPRRAVPRQPRVRRASGPASRTRRSGCSAGPAPSWSTARSPT